MWKIRDSIEPIGAIRDDIRCGIIASTVANAAGPKKPFSALDFMPKFEHQQKEPMPVDDKVDRLFKWVKTQQLKKQKQEPKPTPKPKKKGKHGNRKSIS